MDRKDGMNYMPQAKVEKVVEKNTFIIAAVGLDHGHIYCMTEGLVKAGATLKWVYDPDAQKVAKFLQTFPQAKIADSEEQVLLDDEVVLVASACIPSDRAPFGIRVMRSGKDYFVDKTPMVSLEQLEEVKAVCKETGKKYAVSYSERILSEAGVYAGYLIDQGVIGKVLQVVGLGPHRLNAPSRPKWFFEKEKYGGILCDIGSHQIEQFLYYTGATDATLVNSSVSNYNHPQYPELEDFGDANLIADNGATCYFRVDWFTPEGLCTWGDGRTFILGTEGYIELRKFVNVGVDARENHVYWVDQHGEHSECVDGKVGFPFFGEFILDCINRTENAMTQEHAFKAVELCIKAQSSARVI
ncbi:MAG: Gfo/Idh/MocA family oxidoreductase [Eubacteriales bacterium]